MFKGDLSATIIRMDLERALGSRALTPRQRQVVALYYFACLTQEETAAVLGISQQAVDARLKTGLASIAAHMAAEEEVKVLQLIAVSDEGSDKGAIQRWVSDVANNEKEWWRVTDEVRDAIQAQFGDSVEEGDQETSGPEEYPYLTEEQMNWRQRREISRPEIYPRGDNYGTVRSPEDGKKQRLVRGF